MSFFSDVEEIRSVVWDFNSSHSDTLLIFFGGINGGMGGVPVFEFFSVSNSLNAKKLFIRDLNQCWYQKGFLSTHNLEERNIHSIERLKVYIQKKIKDSKSRNIIMIGNSAGGFAALLFGRLLNVDLVLAFSPQTFIDRINREKYKDFRFPAEIKKVYNNTNQDFYDLKKVYQTNYNNTKTEFNIYYDHNHALDNIHATRLQSFPRVLLNRYESGGHKLVKYLRDRGELNRILNTKLSLYIS